MGTEMLRVLVSPVTYLSIRHEAKRWSDWWYPLFFAVLSTLLVLKFGSGGVVLGSDGLLSKLLVVTSVLPGFYIAALAAIAAFSRPDIDQLMPPPVPTIVHKIGGQKNQIELTRRRFLAHLFAFLCFESLVLLIICIFASIAGAAIAEVFPDWARHVLRIGFVFSLLIMFWQMVFGTLLGLYYLGDRLYRSY